MAQPILSAAELSKRFGGILALDEVALTVGPGELHAVIGPNGAGKSTLVAALAGELEVDSGSIHFAGHDVSGFGPARRAGLGMARSFQITSTFREFSALDNVALAVQAHAGHSFRFWRAARSDPGLREPARAVLAQLGLAVRADIPVGALSHGERRVVEIAMALAGSPALLLLDEPMAGLGPAEASELIARLLALKGRFAILLIEHDMDAVFTLADRITVLVNGRAIATGAPDAIRADAQVRRAYLGEPESHEAI